MIVCFCVEYLGSRVEVSGYVFVGGGADSRQMMLPYSLGHGDILACQTEKL